MMAATHNGNLPSTRTLTILGCGTLGSAILHGLLASCDKDALFNRPRQHLVSPDDRSQAERSICNGSTDSSLEDESLPKPTHFFACVQTSQSAERLKKELAASPHSVPVTVVHGDNARAVQAADTILLGCQPQDLNTCIGDPSVIEALKGKLLISILAGVTIPQIEAILRPSNLSARAPKTNGAKSSSSMASTMIVRAMPNTASFVRASTTVITSTTTTTPRALRYVHWLFTTIGSVTHIPASQFDLCTALCGSTPAFFALFLDSLLDSAVAQGLKRSEARTMAAETMKGTAMLILGGEAPEEVREKVATPGGSTMQGLLELERKALRGIVADALIQCTAAAGGLGRHADDGQ